MVIELLPFEIDIPTPPVSVAAAGEVVPPIKSCPDVKGTDVTALLAPPTQAAYCVTALPVIGDPPLPISKPVKLIAPVPP